MKPIFFQEIAVLGSGVMGLQIAALFASAGFQVHLYDLAAKDKDPNAIVNQALSMLPKIKPNPISDIHFTKRISPANYDNDLDKIKQCDLIIEVVAERFDIKEAVFKNIADYIADNAILASNTSGLSIEKLAKCLPTHCRKRFCGVHFFNPPRYMHLVELIAHEHTDPHMLNQLETFITSHLGKGVLRAKDTPNFIANRVGVFSLIATMHHAEDLAIPFDVVDALTGQLIGRAKSATLRTADVVGLDTYAHVVHTMAEQLPMDPWSHTYHIPDWLHGLIDGGALGQKTRKGIYEKRGKDIWIYDTALKDYRLADKKPDDAVLAILKEKDLSKRFAALYQSEHPQAQFIWRIFRDLFHYCSVHLQSIAENVRDIDLAMRWGFAWEQGPFEIWQQAGWQAVVSYLQQDIKAGKTLSDTHLPNWAFESTRVAVYSEGGAYAPLPGTYQGRSALPVYTRQLSPTPVLSETPLTGDILFEDDFVCLWQNEDDGIGILSFKSKMNTVSQGVLNGIQKAVAMAEEKCQALVLWQRQGAHFSLGADLREFQAAVAKGDGDAVYHAVHNFQKATSRLRYCQIPTVAAVKGMALGGGCEILLHCDHVVAHLESYMGLVEVGVGLLPAGGGCKEMALRAFQEAQLAQTKVMPLLQKYFLQIGKGEVSSSAHDAKAKGYLRASDTIIFHADELLYVAKAQAKAMSMSVYTPRYPDLIEAQGEAGVADLNMLLVNMRAGGFISEHDECIANAIAQVMCGGNITALSPVSESWLLDLEREHFVRLAMMPLTQARIAYTLKNGKPLRN